MSDFKVLRFRAKPDTDQKNLINKTYGCNRLVHNMLLEEKIKYKKDCNKTLFNTPAHLKEKYKFLSDCDSMSFCNVQQDLEESWSVCLAAGKFPVYWKKGKSPRTYRTDVIRRHNKAGEEKTNIWFVFKSKTENYVHLPKLGNLRFIKHRDIPESWRLKHLYICQIPSGEYYLSFVFEVPEGIENKPGSALATIPEEDLKFDAFDYSMSKLFISSSGEFDPHQTDLQWFRKMEEKISEEERALSRMVLHSKNWWKQRMRCNRLYRKVTARRKDFLYKLAQRIAKARDVVVVEGANMEEMAKKQIFESVLYEDTTYVKRFGKAVYDNGFGLFRTILARAMAAKGHLLIRVGRYYPSSQICYSCHHMNTDAKDVEARKIVCPVCGSVYDRDRNACLNILEEGKRLFQLYRNNSEEVVINTCYQLAPVTGANWA